MDGEAVVPPMSFDRLAPFYRSLELLTAGNRLQCCRVAYLDQVADARKALIVGEGPGRFLVEFRKRNRQANVTCVDASAGMLMRAQRRLNDHGLSAPAVRFARADILDWEPTEIDYDLIVTHFFLDCFCPSELELIARRLASITRPNARWLVADFRQPAGGLARLRARLIVGALYWFFRWATALSAQHLTPPDPFLAQNGFRLQERRLSEWGLLHTDLWQRA